ncbi:hypothetical protein A1Q1_02004 [Trichosporon asahii var. asahii CBS 2479]|nr:hypothetical protein A1Q1_02004 [Trichosporon asahii var. asahii CBS 2479]EJT48909.1 hypothetical protein A1Q1_02004 [Trichosporon asahii var. asahii CBS 2479]
MVAKSVDSQPKQLRHKPFHAQLVAQSQPYSKSHMKREKRKAKQQLAGGMGSVAAALVDLAPELAPEPEVETKTPKEKQQAADDAKRRKEEDGKIGQGSKRTMREKQRRKQISAAAVRIPAVMQHPSFRANPWATIREHAGNTLAAAESVKDMEERARQKRTPKANITVGGVKSAGGMEGIE